MAALSLALASVLANMALPAVIGALLERHGIRWTTAVLFGLGLSATVEVTQLTGLWGAYPCPYRRFDIDDLMFNTLGLTLGFACIRRARYARPPAPPIRPPAETSCASPRERLDREEPARPLKTGARAERTRPFALRSPLA